MKQAHSGFSMIEVLVSLLVLTVGILGIAGLQMKSLQGNNGALMRSQAAYFSYEILDRIRANPWETYAIAMDTDPTTPGTDCIGSSSDCTTAQLMALDLAEWKCQLGKWATDTACTTLITQGSLISLDSGLPEGDGSVVTSTTGGVTTVTVTVQWIDQRTIDGNGDPVLSSFAISVRI